ncbi:MAG: flagellar basal body rod protein FlgC [Chlorobiaceae bacterium]|nr:flagellar basal body rod protein FlgC [Chlorobiaceae bacterium]MBA4310962.1 flagellar basal body rod protein FlgC [Chlorobiaceae bacterium]
MKIGESFPGLSHSAMGMSVQRKKMNMIAENIANLDTTRTENGDPYKRKFLIISQSSADLNPQTTGLNPTLKMQGTDTAHITSFAPISNNSPFENNPGIRSEAEEDQSLGEVVYMPEHPDADESGYVQMSNVNVITEMVDMIAATRSYEANLTAFNASKQMAKDTLEI